MEHHDDGKTMIIELKKDDDKKHNKEDDVTLTHSSLFPVKVKDGTFFRNPLFLSCVLLILLIVAVFLLISGMGNKKPPAETTADTSNETTLAPPKTDEQQDPPAVPVGSLHVSGLSEAVRVGGDISSDFALLTDATSLKAVAAKNANERMYPASLTKIMTFLVAYDALSDNLDRQLTLTDSIKSQYPEGSRVGIDKGDILTVEQCMYAMLLESDTDAVLMLVEATAGNEAAFAALMNRKAEEFGLTGTHFTGANGLHDKNHYTTPAEMAVIFAKALQNELFHKIITTQIHVTHLGYYKDGIYTTYRMTFFNSTIKNRFEGNNISTTLPRGIQITGGKTGYTNEAAYCQAALATDASGKEYIAILGHASSSSASASDTACLYTNYLK